MLESKGEIEDVPNGHHGRGQDAAIISIVQMGKQGGEQRNDLKVIQPRAWSLTPASSSLSLLPLLRIPTGISKGKLQQGFCLHRKENETFIKHLFSHLM